MKLQITGEIAQLLECHYSEAGVASILTKPFAPLS